MKEKKIVPKKEYDERVASLERAMEKAKEAHSFSRTSKDLYNYTSSHRPDVEDEKEVDPEKDWSWLDDVGRKPPAKQDPSDF